MWGSPPSPLHKSKTTAPSEQTTTILIQQGELRPSIPARDTFLVSQAVGQGPRLQVTVTAPIVRISLNHEPRSGTGLQLWGESCFVWGQISYRLQRQRQRQRHHHVGQDLRAPPRLHTWGRHSHRARPDTAPTTTNAPPRSSIADFQGIHHTTTSQHQRCTRPDLSVKHHQPTNPSSQLPANRTAHPSSSELGTRTPTSASISRSHSALTVSRATPPLHSGPTAIRPAT